MTQLDLKAVDAFRVTFCPVNGGRNKKLIVQGEVPKVGTECTLKGVPYRIVKIKAERVIACIERGAKGITEVA